jgi:hypothetical protein
MNRYILLLFGALLGFLPASAQTIVDPKDFTQETSPQESNFEFYSRKAGTNKKATFNNVRKRMGALILASGGIAPSPPSATGNTSNLGYFFVDSNDDTWYVDGLGRAIQLEDASTFNASTAFDGDVTGTYDNLQIAANAVGAAEIAAGAVGTSEIATDGVGTSEIAASAVTSSEIRDTTIVTADIKDAAVTAAKMASTAVTPGTYGSATQVAQVTIDQQGRITAAANVAITGVTNWVESFSSATQATSAWTASNAATNVNAAIVPKGNAAIVAAIPDGTTTGGNARGTYAIDLQLSRSAADQVAGSTYSVIYGGRNNKISSSGFAGSIVGGSGNEITATGYNGTIAGNNCIVSADLGSAFGYYGSSYIQGQIAYGFANFSAVGDNQMSTIGAGASITGTATSGQFGGSLLAIPSGKIWNAKVVIVAVGRTVGNGSFVAGDTWSAEYVTCIKNVGGTTALVGTPQLVGAAHADANMATASVTISANNTNDTLSITFTPPSTAGSTSIIRAVAHVTLSELGF